MIPRKNKYEDAEKRLSLMTLEIYFLLSIYRQECSCSSTERRLLGFTIYLAQILVIQNAIRILMISEVSLTGVLVVP